MQWREFALILLAASFIMFFRLGAVPLLDPDEPVYAQTAVEMIANGDYVSPRIYGDFWYDKPPMYYWLVAAAIHVFGATEFAARFPSALLAVIGVCGLYFVGRSFLSKRAGLLSAIILMSSIEYFYLGKAAVTDITLALFFSAALLSYASGRYLFMYVCMGLAVLTKGPVGVVLPGAIVVAHMLCTGRAKEILRLKIVWGIAVIALVAGPWYWAMYQLHGTAFVDTFLGFHNVTRFLEPEHDSGTILYFYIPVLLIGFFPWIGYLIQAIWSGFLNRNGQKGQFLLFLILWLGGVFVFFSLAQTKLVSYILPMYPPMALLVGWYLDDCIAYRRKRSLIIGGAIVFAFGVLLAAALGILSTHEIGKVADGIWLIAGAIICASGAALRAAFSREPLHGFCAVVIGMMMFVVVLMQSILPIASESVSVRHLTDAFKASYKDTSVPVYVDKFYRPGFCFYTGVPGIERKQSVSELLKKDGAAYFLIGKSRYKDLTPEEQARLEVLEQKKNTILARKIK